jgi:hypothetical protein
MNPPKILTMPYGLARTSLTIAGELLPRQLRPGPLLGQAAGVVSRLTGHHSAPQPPRTDATAVPQPPDARQGPTADEGHGPDASDGVDAEQRERLAEASRQRAAATKAKQHASARANRNLSTIRRDLVVAEAQAEVREQQAEEKAKE